MNRNLDSDKIESKESYDEFLNATGFGQKFNVPKLEQSQSTHHGNADHLKLPPKPNKKFAPAPMESEMMAQPMKNYYDISQYQRNSTVIPNSLGDTDERKKEVIPGQINPAFSLQKHKHIKPFPEQNVLGRSGIPNIPPVYSQNWNAVGIGKNRKAVDYLPLASNFLDKNFMEKMTGSAAAGGTKRKIFLAILILSSISSIIILTLIFRNPKNYSLTTVVSGLLSVSFVGLFGYLYKKEGEDLETQMSENVTGQRKSLMETNLNPPILNGEKHPHFRPYYRDERDNKNFRQSPDPQDTIRTRFDRQNTNQNEMEGPRSMLGYKRSKPVGGQAVKGLKRLQAGALMRDPRNNNMDEGTFNEYMARLDGEAPNQFYQAKPYYTMSNQFENRTQINDDETYLGFSTQPGQMMRKSKYKDPRIQQSGAKTSHLKDPPPGSLQPLNKTHPWLERDENGEPLPEMLTTRSKESMGARNAADMQKERIIENQNRPNADNERSMNNFLKPENTMSERKKNINNISNQQEDFNDGMEHQRNQMNLNNVITKPTLENSLHEQNADTSAIDHDSEIAGISTLEAAFGEKLNPSQKEIDDEILDVRR